MVTRKFVIRIIGAILLCPIVSYLIFNYYNNEYNEESETVENDNPIISFYEVYGLSEDIPFEVKVSIPKIEGFIPVDSLDYENYPLNIVGVTDNEQNKKVIMDELVKLNTLPKNSFFCWTKWKEEYRPNKKKYYYLYLLKKYKKELRIKNEEILEAEVRFNEFQNMYKILFKFNESGKYKWMKITSKAAKNNNDCIAMVVDFEVYYCPIVMSPIKSGVFSMLLDDKDETIKIADRINELKKIR